MSGTIRICSVCNEPIPAHKRESALYCNVLCRRKAERAKLQKEGKELARKRDLHLRGLEQDPRFAAVVLHPTIEVLEGWQTVVANGGLGNKECVKFAGTMPEWKPTKVRMIQSATEGCWFMVPGEGVITSEVAPEVVAPKSVADIMDSVFGRNTGRLGETK